MTAAPTGQLILGTDKRNPLFTVYGDEDEGQLHVYYGLELLEVVSDDRNDPNFKMLVGRLYNAGLNLGVLQRTFQVDPKTMVRWGQALRSRDPQELLRVLAGRQADRKLTPEIEAFVRARWPDLSRAGTYGIGKRLRQEIASVFNVQICQETLRPLMGQLRGESAAPAAAGVAAPEAESPAKTTAEGLPPSTPSRVDSQPVSPEATEKPCGCGPESPEEDSEPAPLPALAATPQTHWCDHAGVLLFAPTLLGVEQVLDPLEPLLGQWLASLLLGAINIEQTKFLNWEDMSRLLGSVVRFPHPQRQQLKRVATERSFQALARFNAQQIGALRQSDFYFDPHTKHYTGEQNVLEGWCPAIRWADKAMHSDFIHTAAGQPVYFETTDNFADLRQRFFEVVGRLRQTLEYPAQRVLTWVVDRAIFGKDVFEKVLTDPVLHLVTWEKGYQVQSWPPESGISGGLVIERTRNNAEDLRSYHLQYWDRLWPKDERLRQIVVQATNPDNVTIQVSLLSDDLKRGAIELIRLIFCRWVQENDFKYLDKHFGINQITSYGSVRYEELRDQVEDRQVRSGELKALQEQRRQLRGRQAKLLLLQHQSEQQTAQRQQRIKELEQAPPAQPTTRELARLRQGQARLQTARQARQKQIKDLNKEIGGLEAKLSAAQKTESRLERMIAEQRVRMEPANKRLMDSLRVIARNAFYRVLAPFKKRYNNYRDDHDQFRHLTQSSGVLELRSDQIVVHLLPRVLYPPRVRRIIGEVLAELNEKQPILPDGSGRRLMYRLARRTELKVSIDSDS